MMSKKLQARIKELEDSWKRALADYQNLEKRIVQEKEKFARFANSEFILKILPAIDDLEKAEKHLKDEGLSLALGNLKQGLQDAGLEKIEVKGRKFDPKEMECVEVGQGKEERVIEEIRSGYKLYDRVLRPAQVKVGKQKIDKREKLKEELLRGDYV